MNLDQQIQSLIDQAPQDGRTPDGVRAIAPVLKQFADNLKHPEYYVLQTLEQRWLVNTLRNRASSEAGQPEAEKRIVYASPTLKHAIDAPFRSLDPEIAALPVPVISILFQMISLKTVDSVVFFETPGDYARGTEILCQDVQTVLQAYLERLKHRSQPPPDIA